MTNERLQVNVRLERDLVDELDEMARAESLDGPSWLDDCCAMGSDGSAWSWPSTDIGRGKYRPAAPPRWRAYRCTR